MELGERQSGDKLTDDLSLMTSQREKEVQPRRLLRFARSLCHLGEKRVQPMCLKDC